MDFARCRDVNNRAGTRWLSEIDDDASAARPGREQQAIGDTIGSVVDLLRYRRRGECKSIIIDEKCGDSGDGRNPVGQKPAQQTSAARCRVLAGQRP